MFIYIVLLVWFDWGGGTDCPFIKALALLYYKLTKLSVFL